MDTQTLIQKIKDSLEKGNRKAAIKLISGLDTNCLERAHCLILSKLARECSLNSMALKILSHIVYSHESASSAKEETLEYAINLLCLGAYKEAVLVLSRSEIETVEDRTFYLGLGYFHLWEIKKAEDAFNSFLKASTNSNANAQEASLKLAACYRILGDYEKANAVLMHAKAPFPHREFTQMLSHPQSVDSLLLSLPEALKNPLSFEQKYHQALQSKDSLSVLAWLYSCPYPAGRNLLTQRCAQWFKKPTPFFYRNYPGPVRGRVLDLAHGRESVSEGLQLKVGQALHRLLIALLTDRMGPVPIAALFERVFPEERYNPWTSNNRVHQLVRHLKRSFIDFKVPLKVLERKGRYQILPIGEYTIAYTTPLFNLPIDALSLRLELGLPRKPFSVREGAEALKISKRFALQLLKNGEKQGLIRSYGKSKSTLYTFEKPYAD